MDWEEGMVWLATVKNMWNDKMKLLLKKFDSPQGVFDADESALAECLKEADVKAILEHRKNWDWEREKESLKKKKIWVVTEESPDYPERLRIIEDRPKILFGLGERSRMEQISTHSIAIIGARICSLYGKYVAEKFGKELAYHGVTVVSGMARGVDCSAHRGSLDGNGITVAVLGCGVDVCYPSENRLLYEEICRKGIILSEYAPGTKPMPWQFPKRNRIISGLSDGVVIVEAKEASGSQITACWALEQGIDVYAVPGRINDPLSVGCNRLIREGAAPVLDVSDILFSLGINRKNLQKEKIFLEKENKVVYSVLGLSPQTMDEIMKKTNMEYEQLQEILLNLQLSGLVEEPAKNYYVKKHL